MSHIPKLWHTLPLKSVYLKISVCSCRWRGGGSTCRGVARGDPKRSLTSRCSHRGSTAGGSVSCRSAPQATSKPPCPSFRVTMCRPLQVTTHWTTKPPAVPSRLWWRTPSTPGTASSTSLRPPTRWAEVQLVGQHRSLSVQRDYGHTFESVYLYYDASYSYNCDLSWDENNVGSKICQCSFTWLHHTDN